MRPVLALVPLTALAACFDAEVTVDFVDAETVEVSATTRLSRELYDMGASMDGRDPCVGAQGTLTAEDYICVQEVSAGIDALAGEAPPTLGLDGMELGQGMTLTRDDANTVTVSFDLDPDSGPDELAGLEAAMAPAFAGHSLIFRVQGHKILSTTGTISQDGTEAEVVIPLSALATGNLPVDTPFVTTVQLEANCRLFGLWCD